MLPLGAGADPCIPEVNKSAPELKTGINDLFAKNDLAVVDVRIGVSR